MDRPCDEWKLQNKFEYGVNQSEQILKKNIINSLLVERFNAPPTATTTHTLIGSKTEDTGVDQKASLEMSNGNQEDGDRCGAN